MEELFDESDEETTFTWQDLEQNINLLNEAVAQLVIANTEATALLEEIQEKVTVHENLVAEVLKESKFLNEAIVKFQTKPVRDDEGIEKLKNVVQSLIKLQRPVTSPSFGFSHSPRTVVMGLLVVAAIVSVATSIAIHIFPPPASAKTEQQWYAIFQRVDRLYQERFGKNN